VVYCGGLENRFGLTADGGSNPSLSARKFCEQLDNCNLGGRHRGGLCLFVVARTNPAVVRLCAGNMGRIKKMFMADLAGVERLDGAYGDLNRFARGLHLRAGFCF
jgi:hypothetical protein